MKKIIIFSMIAALLLLIAACGTNNSGTADESQGTKGEGATETPELAEVDIMLDWFPNAVHSYLYVAQEKGYFEEEGVKVNIQFPANPTDPINLAAAGQITLGITYQPDVIMAREKGVPVKSIGAVVRSPLNHIVVLEDSSIESPKDLEGKKVGYPGIPVNIPLLKTMVATDGGNPDEVEMVDVGFELGSSIVTGNVDAVIGAYINHEVPVLAHKGHDTRFFNPVDFGVPSFYELVVVTNDATWENNEDAIRAFWRGATKGYEFMRDNPEDALNVLLTNQDEANFPLIEEVEKQSLEILLPKMASEQGFGSQEAASWEETIQWLKNFGLIEEEPVIEEIFVNIVE
jgi:putative hydroxymethylpyrimidine transport system substrate-binding protein